MAARAVRHDLDAVGDPTTTLTAEDKQEDQKQNDG